MKRIIILMGIPGSGKGTQAKIISNKYNYFHLSTGDLLRSLAKKEDLSVEERQVLDYMKKGELVPDEFIYNLVFNKIKQVLKDYPGVILDGAIRNLDQAQTFQKFFEDNGLDKEIVVIEMVLSDELSYQRLINRKVCPKCGYIVPYDPNHEVEICPKCGTKLETRIDDQPEVIKKRITEQGNKILQPIIDYYDRLGLVKKIDASENIKTIENEIDEILTQL